MFDWFLCIMSACSCNSFTTAEQMMGSTKEFKPQLQLLTYILNMLCVHVSQRMCCVCIMCELTKCCECEGNRSCYALIARTSKNFGSHQML